MTRFNSTSNKRSTGPNRNRPLLRLKHRGRTRQYVLTFLLCQPLRLRRPPARHVAAHQRNHHDQRPDRERWPPAFRGSGVGDHEDGLPLRSWNSNRESSTAKVIPTMRPVTTPCAIACSSVLLETFTLTFAPTEDPTKNATPDATRTSATSRTDSATVLSVGSPSTKDDWYGLPLSLFRSLGMGSLLQTRRLSTSKDSTRETAAQIIPARMTTQPRAIARNAHHGITMTCSRVIPNHTRPLSNRPNLAARLRAFHSPPDALSRFPTYRSSGVPISRPQETPAVLCGLSLANEPLCPPQSAVLYSD